MEGKVIFEPYFFNANLTDWVILTIFLHVSFWCRYELFSIKTVHIRFTIRPKVNLFFLQGA